MDLVIKTLSETLIFSAKQLPYIFIGLFLAELVVALKWIEKLTWITRPVMRFAHLNTGCGIPFLMAFVSPPAANAMLLGFYKQEKISMKELTFAVLVNSFPNALMHWRWWLPAILSVLGYVGVIYFALIVSAEFLRLIIFLMISRYVMTPSGVSIHAVEQDDRVITKKEAALTGLKATLKMGFRILKIFIPVTLAIFLLSNLGFFDWLSNALKGIAGYFPVPLEGIPIIAAQFGNSLIAFGVAGNLFVQDILTAKEIVLTLFVGRIFSIIFLAVRMQIPMVVGIFGQKIGFRIIGARVASAIAIDLAMIILIYFFW